MNKRIAKKKYKKAVEIMKNPKAHGLAAVMIVNQACVDTNGVFLYTSYVLTRN